MILFNLFLLLIFSTFTSTHKDILADFEIHPDFNLELVASEPLVFDPIEMKFDENGDAFVIEMPSYPQKDIGGRLVMLKDENMDGIYDKRVVYADDLGVATSFLPYLGGFLVASPPHLYHLKDTDKDGLVDKRISLISGFSNDNLQHNYNGLVYGLDNWIYAANGGNNGSPYFESQPENILDLRQDDLRFNLEKEQLERVGKSSGGFIITFDNWGHLFETHNMNHISQLVFEDRYTENIPGSPSNALVNISDHEENGTSRIYPIGEQETRLNHPEQSGYFSGGVGITFYGGGSFPKEFDSGIFVADCVLNLIHLDILSEDGTSFKASRKNDNVEFLASKDRSFRPVNMSVGPDGALYVIDMHRDVIEHPEWIPDDLEAEMDLNAGKDQGRIYRITPKKGWESHKKPVSPKDPKSLVASLQSSNQWERTTAQRLIVTNKITEATPFLKVQLENSNDPLARLHSMWTLEGLSALSQPLLIRCLEDESKYVRENAIKIAETRLNGDTSLVETLLELLKDEHARVRMQASLSLSTVNDKTYRQYEGKIAEALTFALEHFDNDIWLIRAISSAAHRQALRFMQTQLALDQNPHQAKLQVIENLAELIGVRNMPAENALLLDAIREDEVSGSAVTKIVEALSRGWQNGTKTGIKNKHLMQLALEKIEKGRDIALIRASGKLRQASGLPPSSMIKPLIKNASSAIFNNNIALAQRLEYLQLVALDEFDNREDLLYSLLDSKMPLALQKEAISQLQKSNKRSIGPKILELWKFLGPEARKDATNILLYKSYNHNLLLSAMENNLVSLGEFNLDLERRRVLLFSKDKNIRERAESLFSDSGVVKRKDAIAKMKPALTMKGDVANGKEVFKIVCSACHITGDIGVEVGPVLTEIYRKSKETLLSDILDPNAAVNTNYLNHKLITKDGSIYVGLVYNETDEEIGLRMMGGVTKIINKADIESLTSQGTSLMLEGLEGSMSLQEMADLLAFLQSSD